MAFWSKKEKPPQSPQPVLQARVTRIPDVFYGGANPVVYADAAAKSEPTSVTPKSVPLEGEAPGVSTPRTNRQEVAQMIQESEEKKDMTSPSVSEKDALTQPPKKGHERALVLVGGVLTVLLLVGVSWWYVVRSVGQGTISPTPVVQNTEPIPAPIAPPTPTIVIPPPSSVSTSTTNTTSTDILVPTSTLEVPLVLPLGGLVDAEDVDKDSLTDIEEEVFRTDSGVWDSDNDGYFDGQEVVNLYNPGGFAPVKIIDSGLVREFVHPENTWRLFYPSSWDIGIVDAEKKQILITSITGDYIEIRAMKKLPGESFVAWFGRVAKGDRFTELTRKTNRFMEEVYVRQDGLVAYKDTPETVYVLLYRQGSADTVLYRHVMEMVYQSFRPGVTNVQTAPQSQIPVAN